ncbi:uncharacterized protein LOC141588102 [Silene latifolia]|uniref:uncharacterized protein LOC141588102 n=1 Tax=Silene latifolia TaxID=37657 RepID=UPI003D77AD09
MGHIGGSKPSVAVVQGFVSKYWGKFAAPVVQYFRKGWFSFRFSSHEEMNVVLKKGPWKIGGNSLVLKHWSPMFSFEMEKVSRVPVCVLFSGLDPFLWSDVVLSKISSKLGRPLFADPTTTTKAKLSFARVLIGMDVSKNMPNQVVLNIPYLGQVTQKVVYEWYPYFCKGCGRLGYTLDSCKWEKIKELLARVNREELVVEDDNNAPVQSDLGKSLSPNQDLGLSGKELGGISEVSLVASPEKVRNVDSGKRQAKPGVFQENVGSIGQRSLENSPDSVGITVVMHSVSSEMTLVDNQEVVVPSDKDK